MEFQNKESVYLTLTPDNRSEHIINDRECGEGLEGFKRYIERAVADIFRNAPRSNGWPIVPDHWLLCYQRECKNIPTRRQGDNSNYIHRLTPNKMASDARPVKVVLLRDAVFCRQCGIELLSPEAEHAHLIKRSNYEKITKLRYNGVFLPSNDERKKVIAVETDKGILLFSNNDKGIGGMVRLLQYYEREFFKALKTENRLRIYDVNGLNPDHLKQVDKGCSIDLSEYLEAFPANCLVDADSLNISVLRKEYDLYPTVHNYGVFINGNVDEGYMSDHNYRIAFLLHLTENASPFSGIDIENPYKRSFHRCFRELNLALRWCSTEAEKEAVKREQIRVAKEILHRDYPWVRHLPEQRNESSQALRSEERIAANNSKMKLKY